MNIFKNKRILVTGGTGMIGIYLINELIKLKPNKIICVSLDEKVKFPKIVKFKKVDFENMKTVCL